MRNYRRIVLGLPLLTALALSACSAPGDDAAGGAESEGDALGVLASFYPLQYVAEQVGGDMVNVSTLTPPGAEPHNLELSPATVAQLEEASVVVYLSGFQPAVDEAVAQTSPEHAIDATDAVEPAPADAHEEDAAAGGEEHAEDAHSEGAPAEDAHEHDSEDPHFWLDPELLAEVAHLVADELAAVDPGNAASYEANAEELTEELTALDEEFATGLANCENRTIVVSHEAYGYLADKYDLNQVGISGLDPETEPSPARLAEIGEVVENEDVTTIFTESLVNPRVAETLAADLGVETALLDPVEGLVDENSNYQQVMRDNLAALRGALSCS